jgi:hypothetical protein
MQTVNLNGRDNRKSLIPLFGICLFLLLYIVAALLYPGGSNAEKVSSGFSLQDNYWCDLMANTAKNGLVNPARPIAITAWIILCFSLGLFWIYLPGLFDVKNINHTIIQYAGTLTAIVAIFSFTRFHDVVINLSGIFGSITSIAAFIELKKAKQNDLLLMASFCYFLGVVNYFFYTTNFLISQLPLLQKITYLLCLLTFGLASYRIYRKDAFILYKQTFSNEKNPGY